MPGRLPSWKIYKTALPMKRSASILKTGKTCKPGGCMPSVRWMSWRPMCSPANVSRRGATSRLSVTTTNARTSLTPMTAALMLSASPPRPRQCQRPRLLHLQRRLLRHPPATYWPAALWSAFPMNTTCAQARGRYAFCPHCATPRRTPSTFRRNATVPSVLGSWMTCSISPPTATSTHRGIRARCLPSAFMTASYMKTMKLLWKRLTSAVALTQKTLPTCRGCFLTAKA